MKLRNKKTGHIIECSVVCSDENLSPRLIESNEGRPITLAELNAEWEDAPEEPKAWWYIDIHLVVKQGELFLSRYAEKLKEVGNYFETREEAEKAVEKLKAWKRLRDKGIQFELRPGIARGEIRYYVTEESNEVEHDLQICFGGEE